MYNTIKINTERNIYMNIPEKIALGKTYLGIELGSTRIKAVLTDDTFSPIAGGSYSWENRFENGVWTYSPDDIHTGIRSCYASLAADVSEKYGAELTTFGAMGISAMMHGYMAFDKNDELLVPFRTWRNTITAQSAAELTELLGFNMPQRFNNRQQRRFVCRGFHPLFPGNVCRPLGCLRFERVNNPCTLSFRAFRARDRVYIYIHSVSPPLGGWKVSPLFVFLRSSGIFSSMYLQ